MPTTEVANEENGLNAMAVKLYQIDTIVVGRFNPFIITPEWVKKEGIAEPDTMELRVGLTPKDLAFRFKTKRLGWQVDYNHLVIDTDDISENPAAKAAEVLEKLPHTPVTALGNNFHFRGEFSRWKADWPYLGKKWNFETLSTQGKILGVGWNCRIEKENGLVVGVEIEQTEETFQVNMNFHRAATDKDKAIAAANCFPQDRESSKEILKNLIGETVDK